MHVTIVTGEFPVLSQTFIVGKVLALSSRGVQVQVMATDAGDPEVLRSLMADRPPGLTIRYLHARINPALRALRLPVLLAAAARRSPGETARLVGRLRASHGSGPRLAERLYRLLPFVGLRTDVIHFEFAGKAAELVELVEFLPCRKVVSCRGTDVSIQPLVSASLGDRLRRVFASVDRVHCVSAEVRERARRYGLDPARAFVNHPAIDERYFAPTAPATRAGAEQGGPPVIVSVGRLHWVKGYEYALQAIRLLKDQGQPVRYRIVGGGPGEDAVRYAIWELGLEGEVELLGAQPRERVRTLLAAADLFLLSSVSEGLSNTALEAMAMGLPVVTTAAGGMGEAVRDGQDGFVVPTRRPELMADRLACLARDAARRAAMGQSARRRIEESFTIERQTDRFLEVYRELVPDGTRGGKPAPAA